jgi:hypothetical protein
LDTLRRWEQNRHLTQIDAAHRMAKATGIGIDELVLSCDREPEAPSTEKPKRPRGRPRQGVGGRNR